MLATGTKASGLCFLFSLCLHVLLVPPDPVQLRGPSAAHKEVDSEQVPVLRDNNQWISGPDQACGCQHSRLGHTEFICWSSHISQSSKHQTPFKHRGPEEHCFGTCWVVVQRPQFGGQYVLDPVQNPVIGRSQRSHDCRCSEEKKKTLKLEASSLSGWQPTYISLKSTEFEKRLALCLLHEAHRQHGSLR